MLDDDALCSQCICIANYGGLSLTFLPGTIIGGAVRDGRGRGRLPSRLNGKIESGRCM